MKFKMSKCHGQCYDGPSNMAGIKNCVAARLLVKKPRALLTHGYGHANTLIVGDAIKQSNVCHNAKDKMYMYTQYMYYQGVIQRGRHWDLPQKKFSPMWSSELNTVCCITQARRQLPRCCTATEQGLSGRGRRQTKNE